MRRRWRGRRIVILVVSVAAALALVPRAAMAVTAETIRVNVSSWATEANSSTDYPAAASEGGRFVVFPSRASNLVRGDTNGVTDVFVHNRKTGKTWRLSVSSSEAQANGESDTPVISADGRYVVFASWATNLVAHDTNNALDVFIRDRALGKTRRLSVSSSGVQANDGSFNPSISADGEHVAFASFASNLTRAVQLWPDQSNVFVRDRSTGKTRRVSISSAGAEANEDSYGPSISADGNVIVFDSEATNLVEGDTNRVSDVFVRVRSAHKTRRVSVSSAGAQANGPTGAADISADGRFVAFTSVATNLVDEDSNEQADVFVRNLSRGKTWRMSISSAQAQGNSRSDAPDISADGRYVAFRSEATNLAGTLWSDTDANGSADVFVRDRSAGTTRLVSLRFDGNQGNGDSYSPAITGRGRFAAFISLATNLVVGDLNGSPDVFLRGPLY